jgi:hypothetical protein
MAKEKINFEQFMESVNADNKPFIQDLHNHLLDKGCKVAFEEKKNGFLASYKLGKPQRAFLNFVFRKHGMLVRVYGENASKYADFLNTMPEEMTQSIKNAGDCKRLVNNTCSPKCTGYDFMIGNEHFQKCKYNCFEFLVADENKPFINSFVEHELKERAAV